MQWQQQHARSAEWRTLRCQVMQVNWETRPKSALFWITIKVRDVKKLIEDVFAYESRGCRWKHVERIRVWFTGMSHYQATCMSLQPPAMSTQKTPLGEQWTLVHEWYMERREPLQVITLTLVAVFNYDKHYGQKNKTTKHTLGTDWISEILSKHTQYSKFEVEGR